MVQSSPEEIEVVVERNGEQQTLRGVRESGSSFVRLPKHLQHLLAPHPAVKAAIRSVLGGKSVNNIWVAVPDDPDSPVQPGQDLLANIRIGKRTGEFAIAAGVALGVILSIRTIKRLHHES